MSASSLALVSLRRVVRSAAILAFTVAILIPIPEPTAAQSDANQVVNPNLFQGLSYRMVGPSRGGRVTAVAGHPAHPFTFYMGATGGGVWKTENYGMSWRPITDAYFETGSIGSIRVAPSDPNIVYVGTGSDGIRSNVIAGRGIYKSTDAGETWTFKGLRDMGQLGAVEVHPTDPDIVYVAALGHAWGKNPERGVYRSTDGGDTWEQVLFTSDSVGAIDLELNAHHPEEIYAAMWRGQRLPWTIISGMEASGRENGIWKSTDGGDTWQIVTEGLPTGLIGKIDLAVTPANGHRVYALVETTDPDEGLYRSDDRGETWRLASNQRGIMNRPFYYTNVDADPQNADIVYVNNEGFYKSTDGGETFQRVSTPHGDNHDMWINPDHPDIFVQSNDGGVNVTLDGGLTWSTQHNQPTAELYQVDLDDRIPYWLYAGQQDNSTIRVPSNAPPGGSSGGHTGNWQSIGGCETGPAVPKPGNPNIVYSNCKGRFGRYNALTGQEQQYYVGAVNLYGHNPRDLPYRFQRVVPIEVSPHNPDIVYHGSQYVHRTTDDGVTWEQISHDLTAFRPERQVVSGEPITRDITGEEHYSVLYTIEESPVQAGVIWTGSNDGPVHVTRDGGQTWTDVTPPMPPEGRIQNIDPSPHHAGKAYVAAYRFLLDDYEPYIFKTEDYGETWIRLTDGTNGIPIDHPTRVVREDPDREGLLYAGTEFGIFISFDDGAHWQTFQLNLPATPVTDIKVYRKDLVISTMGRSFWVLDNVSALHQVTDEVLASGAHLFQPEDAYRMRGGGRGGFGGGDPSAPQYAQAGVEIDYYFSSAAGRDVSIEILDASGEVIRTYAGGGPARTTAAQGMRASQMMRMGGSRVDTSPGMHRLVWDLTGTAPGSPRGGPRMVPGEYQVRLTANGRSQTRSFRLLIDPRVAADGVTQADLRDQYDLSMEILELMGEAARVVEELEAAMERVRGQSGQRARQALSELEEIHATLVTDRTISSYPQPMLLDQIQYLYSMLQSADQKPGRDAYERLEARRAEVAELARRIRTAMEGVRR